MSKLFAKQDPEVAFADLDTSDASVDTTIASYQRQSPTKATLKLKSIRGPQFDYTLVIDGIGLPESLSNPGLGAAFASISRLTLSFSNNISDILFSWDGDGNRVPLIQLASAINSGDGQQVLNLFLGGIDTLDANYQNVDISGLPELENINLLELAITAFGNTSNNTIIGNALGNLIVCEEGDDIARGLEGNDTIFGGGGADTLFGAFLNDSFDGEDGNDAMRGGNGRDTLTGGTGRDELWGDFGRNVFANNDDGDSDLIVIKSDQLMFNQLIGKVDTDSNGKKADIIEQLDAIDRIIVQGVATASLSFQKDFVWTDENELGQDPQVYTGIAIFAANKLEAIYTGTDLSLDQIQAITSGDGTVEAVENTKGFYGFW